ncbi:carbohydrate-binding protein [Bacteroidales bacterium]|nr:carbohydrate-binding protein [Bacteroidales bacterium]
MKTTYKLTYILSCAFLSLFINVQGQIDGVKIGPNYIAWEAEATSSPLGMWKIIRPGDFRYNDKGTVSPIGQTHLEFTGNDHNSGPATSPLQYTFTCPKTGTYRLGARLFQRLEGQPEDKCNDVYIKMSGNFTSGNSVALTDLKHNQKFYGRGVDQWGALYNLEVHSTGAHAAAMYNLTKGEAYTLTVSGRAQRTNIDYWLLYETTLPIILQAHNDLASVNPEQYRPPSFTCKTFSAVDMLFTNIDTFTNAQAVSIDGMEVLQIPDSLAWAAAFTVFDGTDGEAKFTLNTLQETAGESTYRLKINGKLIGEAINDNIYGTSIPNNSIQSHAILDSTVTLRNGDTIQVEFNNTSNDLENEASVTSKGRWLSLDICTTGRFASYSVDINKSSIVLLPADSAQLEVNAKLPFNANDSIVWISRDTNIAKVDKSTGQVTSISLGHTQIIARTINGKFKDSCKVEVLLPKPFHPEPSSIPGIIQAEDFDIGGEGITYHDESSYNQGGMYRTNDNVDVENCTDGGYDVGYINEGEWLSYIVNIKETDNYYLEARVASYRNAGMFRIKIDGKDVTNTISFSRTGGLQRWKTIKAEDIDLEKGEHTLTIYFESEGWSLDWFRMHITGRPIHTTSVNISDSAISIEKGMISTITAEVFPDNATDQTVTWSSTDTNIAKVSPIGTISAISAGLVEIIAITNDGGFADTCVVTVTDNATTIANNNITNIAVYPNPFKTEFTVYFNDYNDTKFIVVRNSIGKVVYRQKVNKEKEAHISLSRLTNVKGLYFLEVHGKNYNKTVKLICN